MSEWKETILAILFRGGIILLIAALSVAGYYAQAYTIRKGVHPTGTTEQRVWQLYCQGLRDPELKQTSREGILRWARESVEIYEGGVK